MSIIVVALALAVVVLAVVLLYVSWLAVSLRRALAEEHERAQREYERAEREQDRADKAPQRSRHVITGQVAQHVAPLLPNFPYNPCDVQWIGGTIDAVVWDGLEEGEPEINVVFLECKKSRRGLEPRQRLIKKAIDDHRVSFCTYVPELPEAQTAGDEAVLRRLPIASDRRQETQAPRA